MCEHCNNGKVTHKHEHGDTPDNGRRSLLTAGITAGAGLVAAPLLATGFSGTAAAQPTTAAARSGPTTARAWAARSAHGPFEAVSIERRALGPNDVLLEVLYCGICHSDIHAVHGDWSPPQYPIVPGHEAIGRVIAIGKDVTKFRVGDIGGVGCMVDSCRTCDTCRDDREQNCLNGTTFTYGSPDKLSGGQTYGGYSSHMVVTEHFVIRIPPGVNLAATAPLLCAGITTFSPMQHWSVQAGQKVGVIGLGGLGHVAVKLAAARNADVTVFTTTAGKVGDAKRLGAKDAVLWSAPDTLKAYANRFDLLISTVPEAYPMQPFMNTLRLDGTLVNVGALGQLQGLDGMAQGFGRKSLAGSMIGGIAETQEVIDYCAARKIQADIELIRPSDINQAYDRIINKDIRYRFVIDLTAA